CARHWRTVGPAGSCCSLTDRRSQGCSQPCSSPGSGRASPCRRWVGPVRRRSSRGGPASPGRSRIRWSPWRRTKRPPCSAVLSPGRCCRSATCGPRRCRRCVAAGPARPRCTSSQSGPAESTRSTAPWPCSSTGVACRTRRRLHSRQMWAARSSRSGSALASRAGGSAWCPSSGRERSAWIYSIDGGRDMRDQETSDLLTALAIGAVVGIGAALLLRGEEVSRREKLLREIRPLAKQARKKAHAARRDFERGAKRAGRQASRSASSAFEYVGDGARLGSEAAMDAAAALRRAGADGVSELRDEIAPLVNSAARELRRSAKRTVRDTRRSLRNLRRVSVRYGVLPAAAVAVVLGRMLPDPALAWGPAAHVYSGRQLLDMLLLLPGSTAELLRAYPQSFLYGSIAADISFAKKYVPVGRHCHYWHVGEEILAAADNDRLRAVGYGYLAHLAADTIAHNYFVPRQLMLTSSTKALGHGYWEHRFDVQLGMQNGTIAREVVMEYDHSEADNLFDAVLSGTIFSFETNRRIFRGMIRMQDNDRWKGVFDRVLQGSRWDLAPETMEAY